MKNLLNWKTGAALAAGIIVSDIVYHQWNHFFPPPVPQVPNATYSLPAADNSGKDDYSPFPYSQSIIGVISNQQHLNTKRSLKSVLSGKMPKSIKQWRGYYRYMPGISVRYDTACQENPDAIFFDPVSEEFRKRFLKELGINSIMVKCMDSDPYTYDEEREEEDITNENFVARPLMYSQNTNTCAALYPAPGIDKNIVQLVPIPPETCKEFYIPQINSERLEWTVENLQISSEFLAEFQSHWQRAKNFLNRHISLYGHSPVNPSYVPLSQIPEYFSCSEERAWGTADVLETVQAALEELGFPIESVYFQCDTNNTFPQVIIRSKLNQFFLYGAPPVHVENLSEMQKITRFFTVPSAYPPKIPDEEDVTSMEPEEKNLETENDEENFAYITQKKIIDKLQEEPEIFSLLQELEASVQQKYEFDLLYFLKKKKRIRQKENLDALEEIFQELLHEVFDEWEKKLDNKRIQEREEDMGNWEWILWRWRKFWSTKVPKEYEDIETKVYFNTQRGAPFVEIVMRREDLQVSFMISKNGEIFPLE